MAIVTCLEEETKRLCCCGYCHLFEGGNKEDDRVEGRGAKEYGQSSKEDNRIEGRGGIGKFPEYARNEINQPILFICGRKLTRYNI